MKKIKSTVSVRIEDENTAQPRVVIEQWDGTKSEIMINQEQLSKLLEEAKISE